MLKAFSEWQALERHARQVIQRFERAGNEGFGDDYWRLELPNVFGNIWPDDFRWSVFDSEYDRRFPMVYLWTDGWEEKLRAEHEAWTKTQAGKAAESAERAEYERLKAKFEEGENG